MHNLSIFFWQEWENQPEMALTPDINQPQMEIDETELSRTGLGETDRAYKITEVFRMSLLGV